MLSWNQDNVHGVHVILEIHGILNSILDMGLKEFKKGKEKAKKGETLRGRLYKSI